MPKDQPTNAPSRRGNRQQRSGNRMVFRSTALFFAALISILSVCFSPADDSATSALSIQNNIPLVGIDARTQLIVTGQTETGHDVDLTRDVKYQCEPAGIANIDSTGLVTPIADGKTTITATTVDGKRSQIELFVSGTGITQSVSFPNQVVPIFTKLGCNGGGCHGKIAGQNGFRLSLLGFEPLIDHKHLVAHSLGRRLSVAAPDRSLLLQKTINAVPHGGGARTEADSHEYRLLRRWIAQGMPYGNGDEPTVTAIDVVPPIRRLPQNSTQQIAVIATMSDGSTQDITRAAVFESNDPQMAEVNSTGLVTIGELVGNVAVMARYQGNVSVFQADVPLRMDSLQDESETEPQNPVDRFILKKLKSLGVPQSPNCEDGIFIRRTTLDIAGRLPTIDETKTFVESTSETKRAELVDRLLESEHYAEYFARKWSTILRNRRSGGSLQLSNMLFHGWLTERFRHNVPYDHWVRDLVSARGSTSSNPATVWLSQVSDRNERVEDISQLFLGQRIQCARCHHHPYEKWSQADYAQMEAFFTRVSKKDLGNPSEPIFVSTIGAASAKHPKTGQPLKPVGLDAPDDEIAPESDPRAALADWMTNPENPFFAKSLVNRYWKHFMGRAMVEPEDDMRVTNPPSNPELMDALAESFVSSGYDLKELIRTICLSDTYGASGTPLEDNLVDKRSHSRFYAKRLTAEVLLDSIDRVTLTKTNFAGMPAGTRAVALPDTGFNSYFLSVFGQPQSKTACECERSQEANLAQSLHLLNSKEMQGKLADDNGRAKKLATDTETPIAEKIAELYWVAFSRKPSDGELKSAMEYLSGKEAQRETWEDLIWVLVNSKEFLFNH